MPNEYCAVKVVSKEGFWKRVQQGKERADALVREVLAQALLCQDAQDDFEFGKITALC